MVYLISLQNINPAPFRVVDEINQAMVRGGPPAADRPAARVARTPLAFGRAQDSSNERNVFQCITHACSQGGKQYFLLTPKLLPDLDYGEDTAIQFVFNGPWMQPRSAISLEQFV